MSYQELVKKGFLKEEKIGHDQIVKVLAKSSRNLEIAEVLFKKSYNDASFQFAYEAILSAGRALVFSYGYRPRTTGSHKIVVEFVSSILGKEYQNLVHKFDKMRRKRNYLIYGIELAISKTESENAIKTAGDFIKVIGEMIQKKNSQKKLI